MSLIDVVDGLIGFVPKSKLPKGGVRRRLRTDDDVPLERLRREKRREIHTRYLTKSKYREKNREKIAAQQRAWRAANQDKVRAHRRAWAERNPEKARAMSAATKRRWVEKNAEKKRAYDRAFNAVYAVKNREILRERRRKWYAANKDRINAKRRASRRKTTEVT